MPTKLHSMSIDIVIPNNPEFLGELNGDAEALLQKLDSVNQRRMVFFDEAVDVYVSYRNQDKIDRSDYIMRINASILPAHSIETATNTLSEEVAISNEQTNYGILDTELDDTNILYKDSNCIVWKLSVPITYPRKKFSDPNIFVSATFDSRATPVIESDDTTDEEIQEEVLPDYQPAYPINLLQGLNTPKSEGLRHSEDSSRMVVNEKKVNVKRRTMKHAGIKTSSPLTTRLSIPVSVSLIIKLRSTKPAGRNNILLATLNIETIDDLSKTLAMRDFSDANNLFFTIHNLIVDFKYGDVELFKSEEYEFPFRFSINDSVNLTYKLLNNEFLDTELKKADGSAAGSKQQFSKLVNIKLVLQVEGYDAASKLYVKLSNLITTNWSPFLDFSIIAPPINNSLKTSSNYSHTHTQSGLSKQMNGVADNPRKAALLKNFYKPSNSSTSLLGNSHLNMKKPTKTLVGESASSVTVNLTTNSNSTLSGLKLTFIGKLNIRLGEIVNWRIQAVNNLKNRLNLSLIMQNAQNFGPTPANLQPYSTSNSEVSISQTGETGFVQSRPQMHAVYNSLKLKSSGVIMLNNDIRIGPMEPNTVYDTNIVLVGLSKGVFNLDGIKIFDVNSGDGLDFGKLVEVFVVE